MSSFVDRQFCLTGQHVQNAPDLSPANPCRISMRENHEHVEQLEAEEDDAGGMRQQLSLDIGCRSKLAPLRGRRTSRQSSYTSDLDLTPSTELSPWNDPHLEAEDRKWTEERRKQWTHPQLESTGFQDANPSVGVNFSHYESRNKGLIDGVGGGIGRREGKANDVGSDSDSGKGTVSDCRDSPLEEISFPESTIVDQRKQSVVLHNLETSSDNRCRSIEASSPSHMEHPEDERTLNDKDGCLVEVPCLTELQMVRDSNPMLHHRSDYYPVLSDSPLGVIHSERLASVELYLPSGSPRRAKSQGNKFVDKGFPGDLGVIDQNNNKYFEVPSPSGEDNPRCYDAVASMRYGSNVGPNLETKGTTSHTRYCEADIDVLDASHDMGSSRRELQTKCQDMYGSRPSIQGSHDASSRHGSRHDVHGSRHDIHVSYGNVTPRHEAQDIYHHAYNNHNDIKDSHYDTAYFCHDAYNSRLGVGGRYEASGSSQAYPRGLRFQAGLQNNADTMCSSVDGFPIRHDTTHTSHDSVHDNRQRCIGYSGCYSPINVLSTIPTQHSSDLAPGDLNSTPGRRYVRREPNSPSGVGASRNIPQKGHRHARKSLDNPFVTASESDPELFHEGFDRGLEEPQRYITPAQYRRIRSVPHDCTPNGPKVLGSTHPALQQPFSDQEAVTLPRPAKPGRLAAAASTTEQQVNSCGQTEVKGRRVRQTRRWTNPGLSGAEPEIGELPEKTKTAWNQSGPRFRVPSLFKSRKDSSSIAAIGTGSGTIPGNRTPVRSGTTASNRTMIRSESENGSKTRIGSGNAAESGIETGSSLGSVGDISLWSMSNGSTRSVFDIQETPLPVQGANAGDDRFRRSVSVPNPDGRSRSSASILDRIRARLIPRKKSSPSKNGLNQTQNHEEIHLAVLAPVVTQSADASSGQIDDDETGRSMTAVSMAPVSMTTTFGTSIRTRSPEGAIKSVNDADAIALPAPSSASLSFAAPATPAGFEGCYSGMHASRLKEKKAPPSEEYGNAVSEIVHALERLTVFVNSSVTSAASEEKTIIEDEFKEHRSRMIDAVKELNLACKQMIIKTPQSEAAFLQALRGCLHSLGGLANKYSALIDCASLPADKSKVATPVIAVATSLRETVTVAHRLAGCRAREPMMLQLRRKADQLVSDLGLLMKSVREMNYNRLSRRF